MFVIIIIVHNVLLSTSNFPPMLQHVAKCISVQQYQYTYLKTFIIIVFIHFSYVAKSNQIKQNNKCLEITMSFHIRLNQHNEIH